LHAFTGARGEWSQHRLDIYARFSAVADVIILDQRGYSTRGTTLQASNHVVVPLDRALTVQALAQAWTAYARGLPAANPNHDLSGYNITQCAADVDDLRKALGYSKLSLLGESFGSQWSFAVMRLYPNTVARAMLSGVEPLDGGFDMPSYVFAAMQRIAFDADQAEKLKPYLPAGGLMAAVHELRDRFARNAVTVRVTDAKTGKVESVVLGLEDLQSALIPGDAKAWPAFILSLYHGHYEGWARDEIAGRKAVTFSQPINPLIDSGIGVTAARRHLLYTDPATQFLGTWNFAPHLGSRAAWPTPDLGDALRTPVASEIPVLFVNGDWDTSTPLENMLGIAPYFPNSHSIIVHRGVHDVGYDRGEPAWRPTQRPEIFAAFLEFLGSGATAKLPAEFSLPMPAFAAPSFPPPK
jgi:pimeloyl-ACP methyl ester carboxylesterase